MLRRLLLILFGVLAAVTATAADNRLALVIGNAGYQSLGTLANPGNDATLMTETLRAVGFDVTALADLDQRGMKRAVGDFAEKVARGGAGAIALFYYAGHGIQVGGVNYLIPVDADIRQRKRRRHPGDAAARYPRRHRTGARIRQHHHSRRLP